MFDALANRDINILAISTSISTISCVIEAKNLAEAAEAIRDAFELP
jgi:aspartokinase